MFGRKIDVAGRKVSGGKKWSVSDVEFIYAGRLVKGPVFLLL